MRFRKCPENCPSKERIASLGGGKFVKVAVSGERFWLLLDDKRYWSKGKICGFVDNDLVVAKMKRGKRVCVVPSQIWNVMR